jgi:simple sugar transport system permease protein
VTRRRLLGIVEPTLFSVLIAIVALAIAMAIVAITGKSPELALQALWDGAFGSTSQFASTLNAMVPLVLVALGWIFAFRGKRVNVGLEGQMLIGGAVSAAIALKVTGLPIVLHLTLAVVGGALGGALYAGLAAWMWARRDVNEIVSTLMLNLIAVQVISWVIRGPLQIPGADLSQTATFPDSSRWPQIIVNTALSWDVVLPLAALLATAFVLARTSFGFRLRLTGANEEAAQHAGVRVRRVAVGALAISGALAGLAGSSVLIGGQTGTMTDGFAAGIGFEGIAVALLARNSPAGVLPAALLFAVLQQGGGLMEARLGIPSNLVSITQGIVIVLVAGGAFVLRRRRLARVSGAAEKPQPAAESGETAIPGVA